LLWDIVNFPFTCHHLISGDGFLWTCRICDSWQVVNFRYTVQVCRTSFNAGTRLASATYLWFKHSRNCMGNHWHFTDILYSVFNWFTIMCYQVVDEHQTKSRNEISTLFLTKSINNTGKQLTKNQCVSLWSHYVMTACTKNKMFVIR